MRSHSAHRFQRPRLQLPGHWVPQCHRLQVRDHVCGCANGSQALQPRFQRDVHVGDWTPQDSGEIFGDLAKSLRTGTGQLVSLSKVRPGIRQHLCHAPRNIVGGDWRGLHQVLSAILPGRHPGGPWCAPSSQTSIDCWAKMPAIAPCDDAWVTEGKKGVARSPAA